MHEDENNSVSWQDKQKLIYNAFEILDPIHEIYIRKIGLLQGLKENAFPRKVLENIESSNKDDRILNSS